MTEPTFASPAALLAQLVHRSGQQQKALALTWLEGWNGDPTNKKLSETTVEPRLSAALTDRLDGWRFFFNDPKRSALLFDVLNATDDERDALTRGANERIAGGGHAPKRLVLALHDLGGDALDLLAAVEDSLLADDRLGPAVVLLTIDQYRKLPITYADRGLELVRVADAAAVQSALAERPHALVVSSRPPLDAEGRPCFTRWAAISWNRKTLVIEPADAIDRFAREGALPELASVPDGHRLDALGLVPKPRLEGLPVGPELRSRMEALAAGTLELDPAARLGEALALGIVAASTDAERVRAALASAGLPAEQVTDAAGVERALARARLRAAPPTVLHVDGAWHLVNAEQPAALLGHPLVSVHTISAGPTALSRLAKAVAGRTAVDWELDPRLERAVGELDPGGTDEGLAHARAWMAYGGHLVVGENVPCADGVERLRRILAQPVPRAEQRIEWTRPVGRDGTADPVAHVCALSDPEELRQNVWSQFQPVGSTVWHGREEKLNVVWACHTGTVGNFRDRYYGSFDERGCFSGSIWEGAAAVPAQPLMDDDAWLDATEARGPRAPIAHLRRRYDDAPEVAARLRAQVSWEARSGWGYRPASFEKALAEAREQCGGAGDELCRTEVGIETLKNPDWQELDLALGLVWAALGAALASFTPTRLHDGRWLLPVAPGLLAELRLITAPPDEPARAAVGRTLVLTPSLPAGDGERYPLPAPHNHTTGIHATLSHVFGPVHSWEADAPGIGTVRIGTTVPRSVHIIGEGVACSLRFVADPYGLFARATQAGAAAVVTAVASVAAAASAELRRRDEDAYDDAFED